MTANTLPASIPTEYNGRVFRSRFEADTARRLDLGGFVWDYEPISFLLDDGTHYWPDFLIRSQPGQAPCRIWLECRGYETAKGANQLEGFARLLKPGESFCVIHPRGAAQWFEPSAGGVPKSVPAVGDRFAARVVAYSLHRGEEYDRLCLALTDARNRLALARLRSSLLESAA